MINPRFCHFRNYPVIGLISLFLSVIPADAQQIRTFADVMVKLNEDWEYQPEFLIESLNYFYRSSNLSDHKANDLLFIKAILENPVALKTLNKRVGKATLEKFYQAVPSNPIELNSQLNFNHDICDFKPHYICRLAYEKGFSLLRFFYEDDFRSSQVNSGRIDTWVETNDHKIALRVTNSYAYKDYKFYEIDASDKKDISFKVVTPGTTAFDKKVNAEYHKLNDGKAVSQLVTKFKNQRISACSKAVSFKNLNLTLIATDAGLFIYDSKTAQLLKFFKNFYTGNEVE
jgi:hypothetical protein